MSTIMTRIKDFILPPAKAMEVQKSQLVTPYVPDSFDGLIEHAMYGSVTVNAWNAFRFYQTSSAVSTAVDMIATKCEQIMPVVEIVGGETVDTHPVLDFLGAPNDFQLWRRFIGEIVRHWLLTGNNFLFGAGTVTRSPAGLFAIHPTKISPGGGTRDTYPETYSVSEQTAEGTFKRDRRPAPFGLRYYDGPLREIYHMRGFSSRSQNLLGDSPLESILLDIKQHLAGRVHNTSLLEKGGRPSMSVIFKDPMADDEYERRRRMIERTMQGSHNAGRINIFSSTDMEIKEHNVTNRDMDFVELDSIASRAVYSRYNIPIPLIASDRQTFSNYEIAVCALYDDAVIPTMSIMLEGLSDMLMPRFGLDPARVRLAMDEFGITALRTRTIAEIEKRAKLGVETLNELRESFPGRDPVEGGDAVFASTSPIAGDDMPEPIPVDADLDAGAIGSGSEELDDAA